ncbi:MAG: hydrolase [Ignavibacteriae bacterium]|nr:MAG: hydrolase [Ignavibacteriota bacterium]
MSLRIKAEETAAVCVDIQSRLFPIIHENEQLKKNVITLINGLKVLDIPLLVTQQYTKGLGETVDEIKEAIGEYNYIEKMSFSCCGDTGFMDRLRELDKKNVILMGIESHVCVLQTALDLIDNGYTPVLIADCVSSRKPNDKKFALKRMKSAGAILSTYESILFELTVVSGTEKFKQIAKLIK